MKRPAVLFLLLSVLLHTILYLYRYHGTLLYQQEHYSQYAQSLIQGDFSFIPPEDLRLFPGLPFLIALFSYVSGDTYSAGLAVSFLSLVAIYMLSYFISKSPFLAFTVTIFPPIVFEQTSTVSTETVTIALIFTIIVLLNSTRVRLASFLSGFATIIRPVTICLYVSILIGLLRKRKYLSALISLIYFAFFPTMLIIFNTIFLHSPLIQISKNNEVGRGTFGIFQLLNDLVRAAIWGQWRIFFSGLAYLIFAVLLSVIVFGLRSSFYPKTGKIIKSWFMLSLIFIFAIGPTPFLEESPRYLSILFPIIPVMLYKKFRINPLLMAGMVFIGLTAFI